MKSLPEGCEITLSVYGTSDETGLNIVVSLKGMKTYVEGPIDTGAMLRVMPQDVATDWRVMTRAEIIEYKEDEAT
jgi:hypothetical protein